MGENPTPKVDVEFGYSKVTACKGDFVKVIWRGYHDIQETKEAGCLSGDVGPPIHGWEYSGFVKEFTNDELTAAKGETRYFKCAAHCKATSSRFEVSCPNTPTGSPTNAPTTIKPPTGFPTIVSTVSPTYLPTGSPTIPPTEIPTKIPTASPTIPPTKFPTNLPTASPTNIPTVPPTNHPTGSPTTPPTKFPTNPPTRSPTMPPTESPTNLPTRSPTEPPTKFPTNVPTGSPTIPPTESPTNLPTGSPTVFPTESPTNTPSKAPTKAPITCSDGESFYKNSKSMDSCQWLTSSKSRLKYCTKWLNWGKYNGVVYGPPGFVCRETCKSCDPCFQHNKAKFYFKKRKEKQ